MIGHMTPNIDTKEDGTKIMMVQPAEVATTEALAALIEAIIAEVAVNRIEGTKSLSEVAKPGKTALVHMEERKDRIRGTGSTNKMREPLKRVQLKVLAKRRIISGS